jgi:hypothetical protein
MLLTFSTEDLISLPTLLEYPEGPISGPLRSANERISMSLIVQQKLCIGRDATERTSHSIIIIGSGAEHCENWFNVILHRKIAIVSSSSNDSPEGLHANEENKRRVTEKG